MDRAADDRGRALTRRGARRHLLGEHRYGLVLALTLAAVLYALVARDTPLGLGLRLALQTLTLVVVVAVGRRQPLRHPARAALVVGTGGLVIVGLLVGLLSEAVASLTAAAFAAIAIPELGRGLVGLIRRDGVTVRVVAGALAIYLLIGLTFAYVNNALATSSASDWFAQGTDGTISEQVYYSFTVLTTTGFGDFTAATRVGRALAVSEMLTGQIYLVTVIGLLVGSLGRRATDREPPLERDREH